MKDIGGRQGVTVINDGCMSEWHKEKAAYLVEEGENLEEEGPVVLSSVSLEGEVMERRGLEEVGSSSVAPALQ